MRIRLNITLLIGLLTWSSVLAAFDRQAKHQDRLQGVDLAHRSAGYPATRFPSMATANSSDIVISESVPPARFTQDHVSLYAIPTGGWLTVWQDDRLGSRKVFLQRLDSMGTVIGSNSVMAGSSVGSDFVDPKLAIDSAGRIFLFYRDQTDGLIFGSRYTTSMQLDVPPFLVNDTSLGAFAGPFDFAIYPNGRLVITWENYTPSGPTIQMRIYGATGSPVFGPVKVNSDISPFSHWEPAIAAQSGAGFLITWEDYRNGQADVFARLFAGDGSTLGSDFNLVPPGPDAFAQYTPRVAYSSTAGYVIGWVDLRAGQEIYIQQYNPISGLVGGNRLVSIPNPQNINYDPDIAASAQGNLLVAWATIGATNDIVCQQFFSTLLEDGQPTVQNLETTGSRWWPGARFSHADRYGLGWTESADGAPDVHFMIFSTSGARQMAAERKLNDDTVGAPASSPIIVPLPSNSSCVLFADKRYDAGDIWAQFTTDVGAKTYPNQRINQDSTKVLQSDPAAASSNSKLLMTWVDGRVYNGQSGEWIFARYAALDGSSYENEFIVSDTLQGSIKVDSRVAMTPDGQALVGWIDYRNGSPQVFARWLTSSGQLDGPEIVVSDPVHDMINNDLQISVDSLRRFYAVWLDDGTPTPTTKVRWFNSDKTVGGSYTFSSTIPGVAIEDIASAVDDSGDVNLLWTGINGAVRRLYLTILSRSGLVRSGPSIVTDQFAVDPSEPAIAVDENNFGLAAWVDRRSGRRSIYFNVMRDTARLAQDQPVSTATPEFMVSPHVAARRGLAWFTWLDPRENGLKAYAASLYTMPTAVDDHNPGVPGSFALEQNYPNPFNPSTEIGFTISHRAHMTLAVYNLLGARVRLLADKVFAEGHYRVQWDGTNDAGHRVSSGTYFYRLSGDNFTQSRKMILLK